MPVTLFRSWENIFYSIDPGYATKDAHDLCKKWGVSLKYGNEDSAHKGAQITEIGNKILYATTCTDYRRRQQAQFQAIFILSALFILPEENRKKMAACLIDKIAEFKTSTDEALEKKRAFIVAALVDLLQQFFFNPEKEHRVTLPMVKLIRHEHYLIQTALNEVDEAHFQNCESMGFYISIGLLHDLELYDEDIFGWMQLLEIEKVNIITLGYNKEGNLSYEETEKKTLKPGTLTSDQKQCAWDNFKQNCRNLKEIYYTYTVCPDGSWTKAIPPVRFTVLYFDSAIIPSHEEPEINAGHIECTTRFHDYDPDFDDAEWHDTHKNIKSFSEAADRVKEITKQLNEAFSSARKSNLLLVSPTATQ